MAQGARYGVPDVKCLLQAFEREYALRGSNLFEVQTADGSSDALTLQVEVFASNHFAFDFGVGQSIFDARGLRGEVERVAAVVVEVAEDIVHKANHLLAVGGEDASTRHEAVFDSGDVLIVFFVNSYFFDSEAVVLVEELVQVVAAFSLEPFVDGHRLIGIGRHDVRTAGRFVEGSCMHEHTVVGDAGGEVILEVGLLHVVLFAVEGNDSRRTA